MASGFARVDDKHVPVYRIVWVADTPHFCGQDGCEFEGRYEVRLEQGESVFGTREERDGVLMALEHWQMGGGEDEHEEWQ